MMSLGIAFTLVCVGAVSHGLWNALVKRSRTADTMFIWVYSALGTPVMCCVLLWGSLYEGLGPAWWAALVSMALHTLYAVVLQKVYAVSDLVLVYPVSRGLAPVMVTLISVPWIGLPGALPSIALPVVLVGVFLVGGISIRELAKPRGVWAGMGVAVCTALYTLWDAYSIDVLNVNLTSYIALSSLAQFVLLTGLLFRRRGEFRAAVVASWRAAVPITLLVPASYLVILVAMNLAPPSMIATARTMNVVFGVIAAAWLLKEPLTARSICGVVLITLGSVMSAV